MDDNAAEGAIDLEFLEMRREQCAYIMSRSAYVNADAAQSSKCSRRSILSVGTLPVVNQQPRTLHCINRCVSVLPQSR